MLVSGYCDPPFRANGRDPFDVCALGLEALVMSYIGDPRRVELGAKPTAPDVAIQE